MTKDNFIKYVNKYWEDFEKYWMDKDPINIIHASYPIAKTQAIVNYLKYIVSCKDYLSQIIEDNDSEACEILTHKIIPIMPDGFNLINEIYENEYNYNIPMWTIYDDISTIIIDYADDIIEKIKKEIKD